MNAKRFFQSFVTIVLLLAALFPLSVNAAPTVLYVKAGGLTSGSCDSWDNACELQYALTSAVSGQEIWVAAGVYKPTTDPTDRTATFQLKNGVGLYGGFAGTETTREERNWETNKTRLTGDIDNNDINDDGNFIAETINDIQGGNSYHVVIGSSLDNTAVLDGFTITAGQANISGYSNGGGMFNEYYSNPILTNIVFSANMASNTPDLPGDGGGMYNNYYSNPALTNVSFVANSASLGGGLYNSNDSSASLTRVNFTANLAGSGAGMMNSQSNPNLNNVIFHANSASWSGGGMFNSNGSPTMTNVTFSANSATTYGGGLASGTYYPPNIVNSILWGNNAVYGPQIYNEAYNSPNVSYSDIQGGWPGTGNIDADPLFVDAANGDLHLQAGSPAIDSGTNDGYPSTDFDGISRPQDGNGDGSAICDMGAYEFVSPILHIKIDIKPGSSTNPINLGAKGVIPVAVLTTPDFNAATLNPATVLFAGAKPLKWSKKDVDYDGDIDLVFHFDIRKLQLTRSSIEASLTGNTFDGRQVQGTDKVRIVPVVSYP